MHPVVLIIDDEPIFRLYLEKTLGKKFPVVLKSEGQDALNWIEEGHIPDVVICDLNMPGFDGLAILRKLKSMDITSGIPFIILTGMEDDKEKMLCLQSGAAGYFVKPVNLPQIISFIEEIVTAGI